MTEQSRPELPSQVVLRNYPVRLGVAGDEHTQAVIREFQLIGRAEAGELAVPHRLVELANAFSRQYATELDEPERLRNEAFAAGATSMDLAYPVRPETAQVALVWRAMMREVDDYCRSGELLTLETPPLLVELREWVIEEFLRQTSGEPPEPWAGPHDLPDRAR